MMGKLVHVGLGNFLSADRIIAIASPSSEPIRRLIQKGRDQGMMIDVTMGRRTKAVLIMDSGHIVLAAIGSEAIAGRVGSGRRGRGRSGAVDEMDEDDDEDSGARQGRLYPLLVVISGPSGVGKDALISRLKELRPSIAFIVTATTRPKREDEVDGVDYVFTDEARFQAMIARGDLLEHAQVYGCHYGVPKQPVLEALARDCDAMVRTDIQGAHYIKKTMPQAVTIFVAPPSWDELRERLLQRGTESDEQLGIRLSMAREELEVVSSFDHVVINRSGRLDEAVREVEAILSRERQRAERVSLPGQA